MKTIQKRADSKKPKKVKIVIVKAKLITPKNDNALVEEMNNRAHDYYRAFPHVLRTMASLDRQIRQDFALQGSHGKHIVFDPLAARAEKPPYSLKAQKKSKTKKK